MINDKECVHINNIYFHTQKLLVQHMKEHGWGWCILTECKIHIVNINTNIKIKIKNNNNDI